MDAADNTQTSMYAEGDGRPRRCDVHEEPGYKNSFVCNLTWPALKALPMADFPDGLTLHMTYEEGREAAEMDHELASIPIDSIEISKDEVVCYIHTNGPHEWEFVLWNILCLADLIDKDTDYDYEKWFDFTSVPSVDEYVANLVRLAAGNGFSVRNDSLPDYNVEVVMTKKLAPTRSREGSVFDFIVEEFRPISKAMLAFVAEKTVLHDLYHGESIGFVYPQKVGR